MQAISTSPSRALEFGIYRDGDNNLDSVQSATIGQAVSTSERRDDIEFTVEDTTSRKGLERAGHLRTESYRIADGSIDDAKVSPAHNMSNRTDLAHFVARTLDNAERTHAKATWVDLVDHGGGDGGGLQSKSGDIMRADDIAGAISDGVAEHARKHPEDSGRHVDGVVANQCLMSTLAFASGLSHAGVQYLAASPETMLAPGVPSTVAGDVADHLNDPGAMAHAMVNDVMRTRYDAGDGDRFGPAAAFDVIDLDPKRIADMNTKVKTLNDALVGAAKDPGERREIREDARSVDGMVRFPEGHGLPWRADRSAISLYDTLASDKRLDPEVRSDAADAEKSVQNIVLAHRESRDFEPFDDASYRDAVGPNVHFPLTKGQIDPWAPSISETDNAFFRSVDGKKLDHALA
ncbi:MAG TPA: hypothetical protein VGZ00_01610 [Candidatus Baltobacteraceae bacterium]|jgi:hypothetical protein|nr:hypothetical protein [Candidatus Baltobacteraceae bacterium]